MLCCEFKCIYTVALLKKKAILLLKYFLNCLNKAALEGFVRNYNSVYTLPFQFKRKLMTAQRAFQIIFFKSKWTRYEHLISHAEVICISIRPSCSAKLVFGGLASCTWTPSVGISWPCGSGEEKQTTLAGQWLPCLRWRRGFSPLEMKECWISSRNLHHLKK